MSDLSPMGSTQDVMGGVLPSKIEQATYQKTMYALRVIDVGNDQQKLLDYAARTDDQPVYIGYAPRGHAEGTDGWLLHKCTYDVSDRITAIKVAWGDWTNRASETYA